MEYFFILSLAARSRIMKENKGCVNSVPVVPAVYFVALEGDDSLPLGLWNQIKVLNYTRQSTKATSKP
jgi:hypothetical protein